MVVVVVSWTVLQQQIVLVVNIVLKANVDQVVVIVLMVNDVLMACALALVPPIIIVRQVKFVLEVFVLPAVEEMLIVVGHRSVLEVVALVFRALNLFQALDVWTLMNAPLILAILQLFVKTPLAVIVAHVVMEKSVMAGLVVAKILANVHEATVIVLILLAAVQIKKAFQDVLIFVQLHHADQDRNVLLSIIMQFVPVQDMLSMLAILIINKLAAKRLNV